ncbi:MAG TPA: tripartite tricarboxylate transporter substrate-binding protein [Burkholderiales bacterium]|nr:tripartite tricarboxylate transporter substrate-binding protein [Burkholderiales bacterium]
MKSSRLACVACIVLIGAPLYAHAQYPAKPVRVVIPLGPGNSVEVVTRLVAQKLSSAMGQSFVIEAQPGAAGAIGAERVARAAADGYTLLAANDAVIAVLPSLQTKSPFNPLRDFLPISQMAGIPFALIAHPSVPAISVRQLIALAKAEPGKIDYASGGNGSAQHLVMEMFMTLTATRLTHVSYKGAPQAALDVIAGQIPVAFAGVPIVVEHIRDGRLRGLGVAGDQRLASLPTVPTIKEQGVPLRFATWAGLFAPAGTPPDIVAHLSTEAVKGVRASDVAAKLGALGFEIYGVPSEPFMQVVKADVARMAEVIRKSGIRPE